MICKKCLHWHNNQKILEYRENYGICEGGLQEDWDENAVIKILIHMPYERVEEGTLNQDSSVMGHKFDLGTHESFGCNKFEKR